MAPKLFIGMWYVPSTAITPLKTTAMKLMLAIIAASAQACDLPENSETPEHKLHSSFFRTSFKPGKNRISPSAGFLPQWGHVSLRMAANT